jgi:hypothetical protein
MSRFLRTLPPSAGGMPRKIRPQALTQWARARLKTDNRILIDHRFGFAGSEYKRIRNGVGLRRERGRKNFIEPNRLS